MVAALHPRLIRGRRFAARGAPPGRFPAASLRSAEFGRAAHAALARAPPASITDGEDAVGTSRASARRTLPKCWRLRLLASPNRSGFGQAARVLSNCGLDELEILGIAEEQREFSVCRRLPAGEFRNTLMALSAPSEGRAGHHSNNRDCTATPRIRVTRDLQPSAFRGPHPSGAGVSGQGSCMRTHRHSASGVAVLHSRG